MIKESCNGKGFKFRPKSETKWVPDLGAILQFVSIALLIIGATITMIIRVESALASQGTRMDGHGERIDKCEKRLVYLSDNKQDKPQ